MHLPFRKITALPQPFCRMLTKRTRIILGKQIHSTLFNMYSNLLQAIVEQDRSFLGSILKGPILDQALTLACNQSLQLKVASNLPLSPQVPNAQKKTAHHYDSEIAKISYHFRVRFVPPYLEDAPVTGWGNYDLPSSWTTFKDGVMDPLLMGEVLLITKKRLALANEQEDERVETHTLRIESRSNEQNWFITDIDNSLHKSMFLLKYDA